MSRAVQPAWETTIDVSKLHPGDTFHNFPDLLAAIGISARTRVHKQPILNELYRFVDFSTIGGIGYKINKIRELPFHKKASSQYQELIQVLLYAHLATIEQLMIETTYKQLFADIAMAGPNYPYIYNEKTYGTMSKEFEEKSIYVPSKEVFEKFRQVASWGMKEKVHSALNYMKDQQLVLWDENLWICHDLAFEGCVGDDGMRFIHLPASHWEKDAYLSIRRKILTDEFGLDKVSEIHKAGKTKVYKQRVDECLREMYGWKYAYNKLRVWYNYEDMKVPLETARRSLLEEAANNGIEVKKDKLNEKIKGMILRRGEKIHESNLVDGGFGIKQKKLADPMSDNVAVNAWNILTGYFISKDTDVSALAAFTPKSDYDDIDDDIDFFL